MIIKWIPIKNDWEIEGELGDLVAIIGHPWDDDDDDDDDKPLFEPAYDIICLDLDGEGEIWANSSKVHRVFGYCKIEEPELICIRENIFSIKTKN